MNNYLKPPILSTSFSESGKGAKKRFENILNTKAKKTGLFAFVFAVMIIAISGTMIVSGTFSTAKDYHLSDIKIEELSQMQIGSDMATLDYASEDRVIFHYSYALVIYNLKEERITRAIDLSKLNVPINTQGESVISIHSTADGNSVIIGSEGMSSEHETYIYDIRKDTLKKIKYPEKYKLFTGLSDMDNSKISGWSSIRCVWISETKQCYLLLSDSFYVSGIKIVIEDDGNTLLYNVFENVYAKAASEAKIILDKLRSFAAADTKAKELVATHKTEFDKLVALDRKVLPYFFSELEKGEVNDLIYENIMMLACREILGDEDIEYTAVRGLHWYNAMKDYILNQYHVKGDNYVRNAYPKASIIIDYAEEFMRSQVPSDYYKTVMDYVGNEYARAFSPYYDLIESFPSNYKETIENDNFEATFFYKGIFKNYYKDPDSVDYIKKAKEQNDVNYKVFYDEYNAPKESNFELKVTAKILPNSNFDMNTLRLYTNVSPKGKLWEPILGFSDFILN